MQENPMLSAIRKEVEANIGRNVILRADKGRKRITTKRGVIESAFQDIFIIRIHNGMETERTVSYTYTDILTETVTLIVC